MSHFRPLLRPLLFGPGAPGGPEAGEPAGGARDGDPEQSHHGGLRVLDAPVDRARRPPDQLDQREMMVAAADGAIFLFFAVNICSLSGGR